MPEARDATYLVNRTRFHTGIYDKALLRDGFSSDEGEADRDILTSLNECITELIFTGQFKCKFSLALQSGVREYRLDPGIGTILRATYSGLPLKSTHVTPLDRFQPGWEITANNPFGTPMEFYTDIPDVVGVNPIPRFSDPTDAPGFEFWAEALVADLVLPGDIPERLPSQFHVFIPHGAAAKILISLGGSDNLEKAKAHLDMWNETMKRVQDQANHSVQDESAQFSPACNYRDFYRGNSGYGGGWW